MYKIFKDKERVFKCNVDVQGVDIKDCKARLIYESDNGIFMLKGEIDKSGICKIKIPKEKFLDEGTSGKIYLEVIAESTIFEAWNSEFEVQFDKKVKIVLEENSDKKEEELISEDSTENIKVSASVIEDDLENNEDDYVSLETKNENNNTKNFIDNITGDIDIDNEDVLDFNTFLNKK